MKTVSIPSLRTPSAVLFDLDGTLLDTAGDIALALSRAFADHGHEGPAPAAVAMPQSTSQAPAAVG